MKAARINEYGSPSVVKIENIATPTPQDNQVLIEVYAASINPFDIKLLAGAFKDQIPLDFPVTLGGDIAGIILATGKNVTAFQPGDSVYGQASVVSGGSGAFAEMAAAMPEQLALMPSSLSYTQAASIALVGVSALQALTEHINLAAGQRLFIHGGGGGIGSVAIQLAKHLGATVTTSALGDQIAFVRDLGADSVIDTRREDISKLPAHFDAVFDTVGGDDFAALANLLKPDGVAVSMVGPLPGPDTVKTGNDIYIQSTKLTTEKLQELARMIDDGVLVPSVNAIYTLDDIGIALSDKLTGNVRGKLVIDMKRDQPQT